MSTLLRLVPGLLLLGEDILLLPAFGGEADFEELLLLAGWTWTRNAHELLDEDL